MTLSILIKSPYKVCSIKTKPAELLITIVYYYKTINIHK